MAIDTLFLERLQNGMNLLGVEFRELKMMGGICFMVDEKMCLGTHIDKKTQESMLIARIGPVQYEQFIESPEVLEFDITGRPMKGFVMIKSSHLETEESIIVWLQRCIDYNPIAPKSKKKSK